MEKTTFIAVAIISLLLLAGIVAAHGGMGRIYGTNEKLEKTLESDKYSDLEEFRKETGFNVMPWVGSEEEFEEMREMHESMEEFHSKYRHGMGMRGFGLSYGLGRGCH